MYFILGFPPFNPLPGLHLTFTRIQARSLMTLCINYIPISNLPYPSQSNTQKRMLLGLLDFLKEQPESLRDHSFLMPGVWAEWNVYGYEIFFDKINKLTPF